MAADSRRDDAVWASVSSVQDGAERGVLSDDALSPGTSYSATNGKFLQSMGAPLRSLQLDACELDDQILSALKVELARFTAMLPQNAVLNLQPEINLFLELVLLLLTVGCGKPTPGMDMLSLKHSSVEVGRKAPSGSTLTTAQRALFCLLQPGCRWIWNRIGTTAIRQKWPEAEEGWKHLTWKLYSHIDLSFHLLTLLNLSLFLRHGRYSTLLDRALKIRKGYSDPMIVRSSVYGLIDQEIFFQHLSEFLVFILPTLNEHFVQVQYAVTQAVRQTRSLLMERVSSLSGVALAERKPKQQVSCPICGKSPIAVTSYAYPCMHSYCYYCLALHLSTFQKFCCKLCGKKVEGIAR